MSSWIGSLFIQPSDTNDRQHGLRWIDFYALGATLYRWLVVVAILVMVVSFFENLELGSLGRLIATFLFALTMVPVAMNFVRKLRRQATSKSIRKTRIALTVLSVLTILVLVFLIPVHIRTFALGRVELTGVRTIFAPEDGRLHWLAKHNQNVVVGQAIVRIENHEIEWNLFQQKQRVSRLERSLQNRKLLRQQGAENSHEIGLLTQSLANAQKILQHEQLRSERMTIRTENSGKLIALSETRKQADPLDVARKTPGVLPINQGCSAIRSEPLAMVYHPDAIQIRLQVPENQIGRIQEADQVQLIICQQSPDYLAGRVTSIDIDKRLPPGLGDVGDVGDAGADESGPIDGYIGVAVQMESLPSDILVDSRVKACIYGKRQPLGLYLWQEFISTLDL